MTKYWFARVPKPPPASPPEPIIVPLPEPDEEEMPGTPRDEPPKPPDPAHLPPIDPPEDRPPAS